MTKKEVCPRCKRTLRTKCFTTNKVTGERVCLRCDKQIGSNKFYNPKAFAKKTYISKFSIRDDEDCYLRSKGVNTTAIRKGLQTMKKISSSKKKAEREKAKQIKEQKDLTNKKFLEGLNGSK